MRKAILALMGGAMLAGCQAGPDNSICTAIIDPPPPKDALESITIQSDADWQRKRADACIHRQAYRLAKSTDPATIVARAAVEACEPAIDGAARRSANEERDPLGIRQAGDQTIDARITEIEAAYEAFALSKVVEGRAGNCRA